jgi:endoglucanase Acf2
MNFITRASLYFRSGVFLALATIGANLPAQTAVPVGSGSYASAVPTADLETDSYYGLPADQVISFYNLLHMDPSLQSLPIPTNHWWTDMLFANRSSLPTGQTEYTIKQDPYGGQMWVIPSMLQPKTYGVDVYYANSWKAANSNGSPQGQFDQGTALPMHGDIPYHIPAADVLIADFENGYPTGTVITGKGFASTPSTGSGLTGLVGNYCASTRDAGDNATGTLTLPSFTVTKHYLNFLICGGNTAGTSVNLIVNGQTVLTASGVDSTDFAWVTWDISAYNGQTAQVEILDNQTGSWGFIAADQIVESDSNNPVGRFGGDLEATNTIVTNWGDWNVDFKMPDSYGDEADFTMARGIPFTWSSWTGMNPKIEPGSSLTFNDTSNNPITVINGSFTASAFSFTFNGKAYGVFLPTNTTVLVGGTGSSSYFEPQLSGTNNYMVIGYLPATSNLAEFATYAYAKPTNTAITWNYDPTNARVETTWTITTTALQGTNLNTLQGWLPHHYRRTTTNFSFKPYTYQTQRGIMQIGAGTSFQINFPFNGVAPVLPAPSTQGLANEFQPSRMDSYLASFQPGTMTGETYGSGKALGLCAQYMAQAKQMGDSTDFNRLKSALETALSNWFTYTPGETEEFFAEYPNWHALIGFNVSYGSQAFNDLHFHYGYYATATALVGMYDPQFLSNYGPMMKNIVKSYGNYDRTDTSEPFLRMFDVWEGHTNAGGTSSPTGENEESSSEAMQSWIGMYLLGGMMNDSQMTAAGAMGYAMQSEAVNEYWEDLYNQNFPTVYGKAWAGQVWASSIVYGTYFTADPDWIYAIQFTPSNHWDNYLVRDQYATAQAKYNDAWSERAAFAAQYPIWSSANAYASGAWVNYNGSLYSALDAVAAGGATPDTDTTDWYYQDNFSTETPDILTAYPGDYNLAYEAQFDPNTAASQFDTYYAASEDIATSTTFAGSTYYIIHAMRDIGLQDYNYSVSIPTSAVYYNSRTNVREAVIYNPSSSAATATIYNNGTSIQSASVPAYTYSVVYVGNAPVITSSTTAIGELTGPFNYQITALNTPTSYNATGLPGGLTVNQATGAITGIPTATGTTTVTLTATNGSGTCTSNLVITVYPFTAPPAISGSLTAAADTSDNFSYTITASNSPLFYNATGLPSGLNINPSTGVISGTPSSIGASNVTISATNAGGTATATLVITSLLNVGLDLTTVTTSGATQTGDPGTNANDGNTSTRWAANGSSYPQTWTINLGQVDSISAVNIDWYSNTSRAYKYKIGLSTNGTTFNYVVTNTSNTTFGPTSDTFTATNAQYVQIDVTGCTDSGGDAAAYEIAVLGIPPPAINSPLTATAASGSSFTYQITTVDNNATSYNATGLPTGLTVNKSTGLISGTTSVTGNVPITISATNSLTTTTALLTLTLTSQATPESDSPTMPQWGLIALTLLLAGFAYPSLARRRNVSSA